MVAPKLVVGREFKISRQSLPSSISVPESMVAEESITIKMVSKVTSGGRSWRFQIVGTSVEAQMSGVAILAAVRSLDKVAKHFIATCGTNGPASAHIKHRFHRETGEPMIRQVTITAITREYFSFAQVHNHRRQGVLAMERMIQTHKWQHRIAHTILGIILVDAYMMYVLENGDEDMTFEDYVGKMAFHFLHFGMPIKRGRTSFKAIAKVHSQVSGIPPYHHLEHIEKHFERNTNTNKARRSNTSMDVTEINDANDEHDNADDEKDDGNVRETANTRKAMHLDCSVCRQHTAFLCVRCSLTSDRPIAVCGPAKRGRPEVYCMVGHHDDVAARERL